jgi:hypothetical protein
VIKSLSGSNGPRTAAHERWVKLAWYIGKYIWNSGFINPGILEGCNYIADLVPQAAHIIGLVGVQVASLSLLRDTAFLALIVI